ncbi:MAG: tetratricopeptide repeat protein, partial [Cyanobacteriota bacterium]
YFCASEIVMRFSKRGAEGGWSLEQLKQEVFREHWRDQSWHEVMRLIIGHDLLDPAFAEDILLDLLNQKAEDGKVSALILAADCYLEIEQKHKVERVAHALRNQLRETLVGEMMVGKFEDSSMSGMRRLNWLIRVFHMEKLIITKLLTLWPDDADLRAWLEQQAAEHDNITLRISIVKELADIELPKDLISKTESLGCLYFSQNRFQDAIDYFLNHQPETPTSRSNLAWAYSGLKHHSAAIDTCRQWLMLEPKNPLAMLDLGRAFREAGQFEEALTALEEASELQRTDAFGQASCLAEKACTYQDMGCYELAVASCERSIEKTPGHSQALGQLGCLYHDLGLDEAAERSYLRAIELDEKYRVAQNNLGCLYRDLERWQEAFTCYERALEIHSKYSAPLKNRGLLHLLRGELERAEQDLRTALQVNQYHASAKLLLGVLQALRRDLNRAQATWQEGLILFPEHNLCSRVHRTIYTVALGQPEQGLAELQRILQQEKPPAGLLRAVLQTAHLLQRCPEPLPGLAEAVRLLEEGRENAPVFELKPQATA